MASGDDSSLSHRAPARETVFRPFTLASPSGVLYIERMFFLRRCINQPIHYLRLYRSLYSNTITPGRDVKTLRLGTSLHQRNEDNSRLDRKVGLPRILPRVARIGASVLAS